MGNRTQMVAPDGTHTYQYDALYRLTSVTYPEPQTDTYTYDPVGNRLSKNTTSYTYDDADQMLTAGGVNYGYDANGNQTSRGSDTFTYDHENRLTQARGFLIPVAPKPQQKPDLPVVFRLKASPSTSASIT